MQTGALLLVSAGGAVLPRGTRERWLLSRQLNRSSLSPVVLQRNTRANASLFGCRVNMLAMQSASFGVRG